MIGDTLGRLGTTLRQTGGTPERTALAFSAGVFIGFSPLLGVQTVLAMLAAVVFRLNRLAVLAGAYVNLPWVMAPYYVAATALGAWLLGQSPPADLGARIDALMSLPSWRAQIEGLVTLVRPFVWAFALGSSLGCTLLAVVSYWPARRFLRRHGHEQQASPDFRQAG